MNTPKPIPIAGASLLLISSMTLAQPFGPPHSPDHPPALGQPPGGVVILVGGPMTAEAVPGPRDREAAAWLGVEIAPVPPSLAAHLGPGSGSLMVRNIFKDSPADKAGLQRYDVIIRVDGEKVGADVGDFTRYVRHRKPGDELKLAYHRQGKQHEAAIRITQRPGEWNHLQLKYPDEPSPDMYDFRGRILRRGPGGWVLEDLGPLPEPGELPRRLETYAKRLWEHQLPPDEREMAEARRVDEAGNILVVRRNKDGAIEVKRFRQKDGEKNAEVKNYPNEQQLELLDREAYDLLKDAETDRLPPPAWSPELRKRFDEARERLRDEMRQYEDAARDLERRTRDHRESLHRWREGMEKRWDEGNWSDRWQQWRDRFFQGPLEDMRPLPPASQPTCKPPMRQGQPPPGPEQAIERPGVPEGPPPAVRFETRPNGSIAVHLREKDAEISRTYPSEEVMKEQAPRLFERYQQLQERFR